MCVMCEITGRDYYHTHNLPISEVTTINGVVQLEYPHILFGDLALWWRTTTREPGEIKYYLAKEGEIFDGVTAITPFDWQLEAITRVVNAINDRLGITISEVSSIDMADLHIIIEDSYGKGGSISGGGIGSDNSMPFDQLTKNFYETHTGSGYKNNTKAVVALSNNTSNPEMQEHWTEGGGLNYDRNN